MRRQEVDVEGVLLDLGDWMAEFRRLSALGFDSAWYVDRYSDVSGSGLGPLEHYVKFGALLDREMRLLHPESPDYSAGKRPKKGPKVSVICLTYNHEGFISDTLRGFVAQRTSFDTEFIVADDCSSDNTAQIIRDFAASDSRIVPVIRTRNLGPASNFREAAQLVRGEYVALCEGDDFWTDPEKLQKQVDFLDEHENYTICFHPIRIIYDGENHEYNDVFPSAEDGPFNLAALVERNFIQTNSVMYRWRYPGGLPSDFQFSAVPGDWYLHLLHAELGKIGFLDEAMGVYRRHEGGMWAHSGSPVHRRRYASGELLFFDDLQRRFGGFFKALFQERLDRVFSSMFHDCLVQGYFSTLLQFLVTNWEITNRELPKLGIRPLEPDVANEGALRGYFRQRFLISVVVLCFNHSRTIRQCIESILAQQGEFRIEIIVGDDASSDESAKIIREMAELHPTVLKPIINVVNIGLLQNLQQCVQACSGDFIAFCEGDDYWLSDRKLTKQLAFLLVNPSAAMCFNWILLEIPESGTFVPHSRQSEIVGSWVNFRDIATSAITANFSCCFYRAESVRNIPDVFYTTKGAADWLFNLYIAKSGKVGFIRDLLSVYRVHQHGLWAGLNPLAQRRRIADARSDLAKLFGPACGFDSLGVQVGVAEEWMHSTWLQAHLDSPESGQFVILDGGSLLLSGWAMHVAGKHIRVVVKRGEDMIFEEANLERADVRRAMAKGSIHRYVDPQCGFRILVEFRAPYDVLELGIECGGEIFWWTSVTAQLATAGSSD